MFNPKEIICKNCGDIVMPTGYNQIYCPKKECRGLVAIMSRENNRDKKRKYSRDFYKKNRKQISEYRKGRYKKFYKSKVADPKHSYGKYKSNAKTRGIEFNLTFEEFSSFWNKKCSYCGNEINGIGLDRVDNKKGYIIENIASSCFICNRLKWTMDKDDFINQCKKISDFN